MGRCKFALTIISILSLLGVEYSNQLPVAKNDSDISAAGSSSEQVNKLPIPTAAAVYQSGSSQDTQPNSGINEDMPDLALDHGQEDDADYNDDHLYPPTRALGAKATLWTGGKVYVHFPATFPKKQKNQIHSAMFAIQNATCIKFYYKGNKTVDYITFQLTEGGKVDGDKGCWSQLGKVGGNQEIVLTINACDSGTNYAGSAAHELLHALGFEHEFQRADRENYITFHREDVDGTDAQVKHNFGPIAGGKTFDVPFNFKSIMQYDPRAGANTSDKYVFTEKKPRGANVTAPIGTYENMGQECKISAGDRRIIDAAYQKQCGLKKLTKYTTDVMIAGTDCGIKIEPMIDEVF